MSDDRTTVELPKGPVGSRYSVKRAVTNERAQSPLVERVGTGPMRTVRAGTEPGTGIGEAMPARWRVELVDDRVTLRGDGVQIELGLDEARRLAETILRAK
jgi:hypothetical protein